MEKVYHPFIERMIPSGSNLEIKDAVKGYSNENPNGMFSYVTSDEEMLKLISSHAKWDAADSDFIVNWIYNLILKMVIFIIYLLDVCLMDLYKMRNL